MLKHSEGLADMIISKDDVLIELSARLADNDVKSVAGGSPLVDKGVAEKVAGFLVYAEAHVEDIAWISDAARAVLFRLGYRESRHFAIGVVLDDLYKKGVLESK